MVNYTKSEILKNIPRHLKTQPGAPRTHLAYITDDEAKMLQKKNPGTPHGTRSGIPSYDYQTESGGWVSGGDAVDVGGTGGSYGGGEDFGSPFGGGAGQPPGTTNEAAVPYGGPPSAYPPPGDGGVDVGGDTTNIDDLILNQDPDDQGATTQGTYTSDPFGFRRGWSGTLLENASQGLSVGDMLETGSLEEIWQKEMEARAAEESGLYTDFLKGEAGYNDLFGIDNLDFNVKINPFGTSTATLNKAFQEGGLASLANPHEDRREDVIPPMVSEGEFLGLGGLGRMGQAQMRKPPPPFGATRENELDQLRAWENAPHHVDPPNIGFKGEKIPAPLYNRIMKYLEGVSPAERTLLEEMINKKGLERFKEKFFDMQERKNIQPIEV